MLFSLNYLSNSLINMNRVIVHYHHHYLIIIILSKHQQKELMKSVKKVFDIEITLFNVSTEQSIIKSHCCVNASCTFSSNICIISDLILNRYVCLMSLTHFLIEDRLIEKDKIICCELMYIILICLSQILILT